MGLPNQPVTLTPDQVAELNQKLADLRHNLNNHLAMISAAGEILQMRPDAVPRVLPSLLERPGQITGEVRRFSAEFEKALGITRD